MDEEAPGGHRRKLAPSYGALSCVEGGSVARMLDFLIFDFLIEKKN